MGPIGDKLQSARRTVDVTVGSGAMPLTWTVTFTSQAVPGTLAAFAGTLALARLDIVSALIRVTAEDTVIDTFDVISLEGPLRGPSDGPRLAALATDVLNGQRDLAAELRDLRRRYPAPAGIPPRVEVQTDSALTTGIYVVAANRPGLLYDITSTLTAHGLRTRSLAALTFNGRGHDTFRVVDSDGKPPTDEAMLDALREELRRVCG